MFNPQFWFKKKNLPDFSKVKLFTTDVDGVLTDGKIIFSDEGVQYKNFNVKDGLGIKLLLEHKIHVAILTASKSPAIIQRANNLGIQIVLTGLTDKLEALHQVCQELQISTAEVVYIGDDVNDIAVIKEVGIGCCVADAHPQVKTIASHITTNPVGAGAVREICDRILASQKIGMN
ncbi:KdsC family phosphatase [Planktothrix sp.]|uniref:KdsC family phosphatase n=1 Tax=Planktothrix sp. TaxID=3088171 RepID=UPI0038D37608